MSELAGLRSAHHHFVVGYEMRRGGRVGVVTRPMRERLVDSGRIRTCDIVVAFNADVYAPARSEMVTLWNVVEATGRMYRGERLL